MGESNWLYIMTILMTDKPPFDWTYPINLPGAPSTWIRSVHMVDAMRALKNRQTAAVADSNVDGHELLAISDWWTYDSYGGYDANIGQFPDNNALRVAGAGCYRHTNLIGDLRIALELICPYYYSPATEEPYTIATLLQEVVEQEDYLYSLDDIASAIGYDDCHLVEILKCIDCLHTIVLDYEVECTHDSWINDESIYTNYGSDPTMRCGYGNIWQSKQFRPYIQFAEKVSSFWIHVEEFVNGAENPFLVRAFSPNTAWDEMTITAANDPGVGAGVGSILGLSGTGWHEIPFSLYYMNGVDLLPHSEGYNEYITISTKEQEDPPEGRPLAPYGIVHKAIQI